MALPLTINTQLPPPSTLPHQTLPLFLRPLRFPGVLRPHEAAAPLPFTYSSSFLLSISRVLSLSLCLTIFQAQPPSSAIVLRFSGGLATDLRCSGSPRTEPSLLPYSFLIPDGQTHPHAPSCSSSSSAFRRAQRRTAAVVVRFDHSLCTLCYFFFAKLFSHFSFLLRFSALLTFGNARFPARWRQPAVVILISFILELCKYFLLLSCLFLRFRASLRRENRNEFEFGFINHLKNILKL